MRIHPSVESDLDHIIDLSDPHGATADCTATRYRTERTSGEFTAARTWLAGPDDGGPPTAVAFWWSENADAPPRALDGLFARG